MLYGDIDLFSCEMSFQYSLHPENFPEAQNWSANFLGEAATNEDPPQDRGEGTEKYPVGDDCDAEVPDREAR